MKTPTKVQANLAVDITKAVMEGKKIQVELSKGKFEVLTLTSDNSTFEGILKLIVEGKKLRVKPLPRLAPWTHAQWEKKFLDPTFYVVRNGEASTKNKICGISRTNISLSNYGNCPFDYMARTFTGPNGEPLGTYEE